MNWSQFRLDELLLHVGAILITAGFSLLLAYWLPSDGHRRTLAGLVGLNALFGSIVYALTFDARLLLLFDMKGLCFVLAGGLAVSVSVRYAMKDVT